MRGLMVYLALVSRDIPGVIVQLMHVFGGCLKKYKNVPKTYRWICFINPYFWGFNGLIQIEYAGFNGIKCSPEVVAADLCITGDQILQVRVRRVCAYEHRGAEATHLPSPFVRDLRGCRGLRSFEASLAISESQLFARIQCGG